MLLQRQTDNIHVETGINNSYKVIQVQNQGQNPGFT